MAQSAWMNEKPLEVLEHVEVDNAWVKFLPEGSVITATKGHGASYWSRTARIDVQLPSGEDEAYFLKLATPNGGLLMCHGEYESMCALHAVSPDFIPKPIGFGTFESNPDQHFFLCEFVDLDDELPHVVEYCEKLADLHQRSAAMAPELKNPEKMFGFHVVTCNGTVPTHQTWEESWEAYYIDNMKHLFAWEEKLQGPSETIQELLPTLYEKVIPRLLRPLETQGRNLTPCLLHGDLWDGNTAVHAKTDEPYIFDASSFWGHNECDLAKWRGSRYRMRRMYVKEYFKHFPISPPEEDWDDRSLLYSLRADLHDSILFPTTTRFRDLLIITLKQLAEKFPNGYEGTAMRKGGEADLGREEHLNVVNGRDASANTAPEQEHRHEDLKMFPLRESPDPSMRIKDAPLNNEDGHVAGVRSDTPARPGIEEIMAREKVRLDDPEIAFGNSSILPDTDEPMEHSPNRTEVASDIGVGESAISPPEGSVVSS